MSVRKYREQVEHKTHVLTRVKLRREKIKEKSKNIDFVIEQFLDKFKQGPDFVCCVCFRLLFKHQVFSCNRKFYQKTKEMSTIAETCIRGDYVHRCNDSCKSPCDIINESNSQLYVTGLV